MYKCRVWYTGFSDEQFEDHRLYDHATAVELTTMLSNSSGKGFVMFPSSNIGDIEDHFMTIIPVDKIVKVVFDELDEEDLD